MIPHSRRAVETMISGTSPRTLLTEEGVSCARKRYSADPLVPTVLTLIGDVRYLRR